MPSTVVARHYRSGELLRISLRDGRFAGLDPSASDSDADAPIVAPGLVDLQVNGFGGVDFNRADLDAEGWAHACDRLRAHGCTRFLATLITHGAEEMERLLTRLRRLREDHPSAGANCAGFHLEGPFLNPDPGTRGAHDPARMLPINAASPALFERWQRAAGGAIRLVTLAPEMGESRDVAAFVGGLRREGVRVSIGHSLAMGKTLAHAFHCGATGWTHLGNAAPREADKFENVIFHALAEERLAVSLIPDGLHLPPHVFKALARALGPRLLLTTDAMAGADAPPGRYTLGTQEVEVRPDGRAVLPGTEKLAGSTQTPFAGVFHAARMIVHTDGPPTPDPWEASSVRPAAWMGWEHGLEAGRPADFCLVEPGPEPRLLATFERGEKVWEKA